jgi:hypothetical protein
MVVCCADCESVNVLERLAFPSQKKRREIKRRAVSVKCCKGSVIKQYERIEGCRLEAVDAALLLLFLDLVHALFEIRALSFQSLGAISFLF